MYKFIEHFLDKKCLFVEEYGAFKGETELWPIIRKLMINDNISLGINFDIAINYIFFLKYHIHK